jgi:hypothetical protein
MELDVLRSTLATVKLLHQTVVEDGGGLEAMTTTTQSSPNLTASTAALFARTMQSNSLAPSSGSSPFYSDDISAVLNPFESSPIVAVGLPQVPPTSWSALRRKLVGGLGDVEDQLSGCLERITFIEKDIVEESQSSIDPNNVVKPEIIQKEPVQPTKSTLSTRLSMPAVKQPQRSSPSIIVQNEGINPGDGKDQSKSLRKKLEDLLS